MTNHVFVIYTSDDNNQPCQQYASRQWKRVQDWLIERGYSGNWKIATPTRERRGLWYAIVRVRYYPASKTLTPIRCEVIAQSRQWAYRMTAYKHVIQWSAV